MVSSVIEFSDKLFSELSHYGKVYVLHHKLKMPFNNLYTTPETLGLDRLALAAAATQQYPKTNSLIIDAGTCITYDFVDASANYFGGAISPGLQMRYKALHNQTAQLLTAAIRFKFIYWNNHRNLHPQWCSVWNCTRNTRHYFNLFIRLFGFNSYFNGW